MLLPPQKPESRLIRDEKAFLKGMARQKRTNQNADTLFDESSVPEPFQNEDYYHGWNHGADHAR